MRSNYRFLLLLPLIHQLDEFFYNLASHETHLFLQDNLCFLTLNLLEADAKRIGFQVC